LKKLASGVCLAVTDAVVAEVAVRAVGSAGEADATDAAKAMTAAKTMDALEVFIPRFISTTRDNRNASVVDNDAKRKTRPKPGLSGAPTADRQNL
jgi:hypothetical protein